MKQIVGILALILASPVFAAPIQETATDPAPQNHSAGSPSGRATSHDRHAHKHRASSHHHRHRTTAKNHS
jgi:Ni/Co efflux regulator RcnB